MHGLAIAPHRNEQTLDVVAKCTCGEVFRDNDKEVVWEELAAHVIDAAVEGGFINFGNFGIRDD